jgi:hypothetical protein
MCALPIGYFVYLDQRARPRMKTFQVVYLTAMSVAVPAMWGTALISRGRQITRPVTAEAVLAKDTRPPVVYIRPFARERDIYVIGPKHTYGQFRERIRFDSAKNPNALIPFEEYLAGTVYRLLGPFVALGSPQDDITPVGAARTYATDDDWQEQFDRIGHSACAFLVQVGDSKNLQWEFEHIRKRGWSERLFIVTAHKTNSFTGRGRKLAEWVNRLYGIPSASWADLVSGLASLGYQPPTDDPGPGAIVTFDAAGAGLVLATGADLPAEFVGPIAERLREVGPAQVSSPGPEPNAIEGSPARPCSPVARGRNTAAP